MNNDSMVIYLAILIGISVLVLGLILFKSLFFSAKNESILKFIQQKNYDDAIKNLRKLVQKDDSNSFAHFCLGEVYFHLEHYDWALPHFRKVIQLNKYNQDVQEIKTRERLAEIFLHYKQLEEAQKELLLILKLKPNDYNYYYRVGDIFYQRHYPDNAGAYYQKALEINPNHVDSLFRIGEILYHSKRTSEALDHLKQCININPACSKAHYYIGMIYLDSRNYNHAVQEFSVSVRDAEYRVQSLYQKGRALMESGHSEKGVFELERGLFYVTENDSASLALRYLLAKGYEETRNLASALEQWEYISQINPDYRDVKKKLNDFS
ncbi:MAG TPA: tetratricopeptide repeat protein, partial [Spirochaetes bacterium]|nr:tetratricopeptide repeat protein [Spirochaetota bacterium]